jgi:hypothetical protein
MVNVDPTLLEIKLAQEHSSVAAVQQAVIVEVRMIVAARRTATLTPVWHQGILPPMVNVVLLSLAT